MKIVLHGAFTIKKVLVCLLGVAVTLIAYQHFWARRILAQSSTTTRIYIPYLSGTDAGYTMLVSVQNTSMDPYGTTATSGTCTADVFYNGTDYSGSLGTVAPGQVTVFTEAQIAAATNAPMANSGQRGYLFLTCNFPYAHAQGLLVNSGGVVSFIPGFIVPPNRGFSTGPEQLLQ